MGVVVMLRDGWEVDGAGAMAGAGAGVLIEVIEKFKMANLTRVTAYVPGDQKHLDFESSRERALAL